MLQKFAVLSQALGIFAILLFESKDISILICIICQNVHYYTVPNLLATHVLFLKQ